jgi:hypothetical protein
VNTRELRSPLTLTQSGGPIIIADAEGRRSNVTIANLVRWRHPHGRRRAYAAVRLIDSNRGGLGSWRRALLVEAPLKLCTVRYRTDPVRQCA